MENLCKKVNGMGKWRGCEEKEHEEVRSATLKDSS